MVVVSFSYITIYYKGNYTVLFLYIHTLMFNTFYIFSVLFLLLNTLFILFFFKSPSLVVVVAECLIILAYVLFVYLASVINDPRLFTCALFLFFIASVELVYFILYFSKIS